MKRVKKVSSKFGVMLVVLRPSSEPAAAPQPGTLRLIRLWYSRWLSRSRDRMPPSDLRPTPAVYRLHTSSTPTEVS